ncbi:hypothetical protein GCM10023185_40270 [Hymenobacter saemangeumensis]|uniref:DUF2157 domain-containing protein n=1 Tax=Hymenobacter saemangeumensis TaxID=1084522 RepID=A0ABP8IS28_9BACT
MSRKFIETDGPQWVEEGIISPEQYARLLGRYPEQERAIGLLPLLGGLLVGLGILSLVAANWQALPELLRLAILLFTLLAAYTAGERALRQGQRPLGIGLLCVGLLTFGAGIVLTGQMYHLVSHDVRALLLWALAGLALTWLYRSRFLFLLTLVILGAAMAYSVHEFEVYSYVGLGLLVLGLGGYWFRYPDNLLGWGFSLGWLTAMGLLLDHTHTPFVWLLPLLGLLYVAGDWLPRRREALAVQLLPLAAAWFVAASVAANGEAESTLEVLRKAGGAYALALLVLLGASAAGKWRQRALPSLSDWLIFLPLFFLPAGPLVIILQLLVLYAFAGAVLWAGYREQWRAEVNAGTVLFILASALAYFRLTWAFLDKSLFFIGGGVLLLALSWWLRRRNEQILAQTPPLAAADAHE